MRRVVHCVSTFLMLLSVHTAFGDSTPAGRTFGDMVGLNTKFTQGEPQKDLPLLTELGVKWVRDSVGWGDIERSAGKYEFPDSFRERLKFYKEHGIGVCYLLAYENTRAYPDSPEKPHNSLDPEAYARYAVEAAKFLKESDVKFVLEVWNEPHNFTLQKKLGGEWNARPPSPWVDHYLKLVQETLKQVKAYDPQVRVIDDEDMWISHYWFLEKGLPRELDGFAFHPYSGASAGPEMTAVGQDTNWAKPFTLTDADRSFQSAVRRLRDQAVTKMGKTPALWATEWGWPIGEKAPTTTLTPDGKMTEDAVASYVPRAFVTASASGVETVLWFSSYDSVDGPMGLRDNKGHRRKAFGAYKTMTQQLARSVFAKQLIGADHRASGVQAFQFHGPEHDTCVLWNIDGKGDFIVTENDARHDLQIVDLQGQPVVGTLTKTGRLVLHLSQSPIYMIGLPTSFTLEPLSDESAAPSFLFP